MSGFITALKSELFVAKHTFVSKLVLISPAFVAAVQNSFTWFMDAGNSASDNLLNGNSFDEVVISNAYGYFVDAMNTLSLIHI